MNFKLWLLLVAFLLLTTFAQASEMPAASSEATKPWEIDLSLRSSIYLPTPRPIQDVFFELNNTTPNLVYRIERSQAEDPINIKKMAYAALSEIPHDVYKITPFALGPFQKGKALGITMEEWIAAIGEGKYIEENGNAILNISFRNLVPNGTYTIWCHNVTMPPNYKYKFWPAGASDGSQNVFRADSSGNATFDLKMEALPESTNLTFEDYVAMYVTKKMPITTNITWTLISVAYHSGGFTHGGTPGELGKNTHMQMTHLMYPKPARTYEEWKNMTIKAAATKMEPAPIKPSEKQPGFEGLLAVFGLLFVAIFARGKLN